jgi:ribosomal protein S18 acetylase RimI-like enzyme
MVKVRPAAPGDIDSLLHLLEALFTLEQDFEPDWDKQRRGLEMLLETADADVVVAERDGRVVGMATMQVVISTAEGGPSGLIEDVVVHESHRGQGIGRALMDHLVGLADQKSLTRLQLLADRDNQPALAFYEKLGWSNTRLIALIRKR